MKRLLIRLYPAMWRERYGDEFESLLEERPLGPFDVADIVLGAFDARLRLRGRGASPTVTRGFTMSLRIGGIAAMVAGAFWGFSLVAFSGVFGANDSRIGYATFLLGTLALLFALIGLSAFQARERPALIWAAFGLPAFGAVASLIGLTSLGLHGDSDGAQVAGMSSWYVWTSGMLATMVGSALFGFVTYRTRVLSRQGAALLTVGSALIFPAFLLEGSGFDALAGVAIAVAIVGCSLGWIVLGASAVRATKPAVDTQPA